MTTPKIIHDRQGERGNVLFLILIAVALFAALSYAVTQSTRSGSGDASGETNLINSAQLAQYPAGVRTSVVRMVIGGVGVDQIGFDTPADFSAVSDLTYNVFHPTGGGAVYQLAPKDVLNAASPGSTSGRWIFSSNFQISGVGSTTDGDDGNVGNDIIAFLPGVAMNVCKKLNDEVGITTSTPLVDTDGIPGTTLSSIPAIADNMVLPNNSGANGTIGIAAGEPDGIIAGDLLGQPFGCFRNGAVGPTTATYIYYHVLVER
jgi:hypothetical protein